MSCGKKIKELRETMGLTQVQLSRKLRVQQATISSWETGVRSPSPVYVAKLLTLAKNKQINIKYDDLK